ncbi:Predicted DNA-binding transcriptional regulator YafY, contains an HTH and WYL domains [Fontibacillus panacisegetis]|uniref:Predicted DNA-binding transcriptional regulator YafY, contains an HTH and WYL domains n=1 Tax=Fontibacillus panacisegetis TaxID=670482 RepID=A0A1G7H8M5_9BACL|nr:WYL domain-containing protein [Fontibacillus panacisegetis]SDE96673.1 Predicted DNA-binding transcriptional regulator YafY, contains an HTH and WYL domains [Fontibacillus panacisegetis]
MRADRLLSILLLLQNNRKMSSRQLAEKLEVSERTIFRDIESLCSAGIPIHAERGSQGGWVLAESYRTNLTGMSEHEISSLLISNYSSLLDDLGIQKHFDSAYQKLLSSTPDVIRRDADITRQRIHIDGVGWHKSEEAFPWLSTVQEAVWSGQKLEVVYKKDDAAVTRIVHPLGLVAKRNVWYMVAESEGNPRTYRISRIIEARLLNETFERPDHFNLAQFWEQSTLEFKSNLPKYPARVRLTEARLIRLKQERYVKILHTKQDSPGFVVADLEFHTLESAGEILLSCGRDAQVLTPFELREHIIAEAAAICSLYST